MRAPIIVPSGQLPRVRMEPPAFFQAVDTAFQRAAAAAGGARDFDYLIGGFRVRLSFAGAALVPALTRALAHLSHIFVTHPMGAPSALVHWNSILDVAGLPASIWFLIVVRRLYHQGLADWNRRPLIGHGLAPRRSAPWAHGAERRGARPWPMSGRRFQSARPW